MDDKTKKKIWKLYFTDLYSYDELEAYFNYEYPYSVLKTTIQERYDTYEPPKVKKRRRKRACKAITN